MDRAQITALLDRADQLLHLGSRAQQLRTELSRTTATKVRGAAVFGDDSSRIQLLDPAQITWSGNLYLRTFFEGMAVEETLGTLSAGLRVLPGLISQVRESQGGLFRRLFNPTLVQAGDQAAFDLMVRLDELAGPAAEVARLLEGADTARAAQARGVQLFPGIHGVGQRYLDAARTELAAALDLRDPRITELPGTALEQARRTVEHYAADRDSEFRLRAEAKRSLEQLARDRVAVLLEQLPVDALRTTTSHRLRFGPLDSIGVNTVADVLRTDISLLITVSGIGTQTAQRMRAAAQTLEREALSRQHTTIGAEPTRPALALVRILARFDRSQTLTPAERERRTRVIDYVRNLPPSTTGHLAIGSGPDHGARTLDRIDTDLAWVNANPELFHPRAVTDPGAGIWADYLDRPAHYQSLLATLLGEDVEGADELLDASVLERIREMELDTTHIRDLHLRGYQSFGARFAVVQEKVLLGDDMGLGKTVQAISVAAHLAAVSPEPFRTLVVVPASVTVNWVRECRRFTDLPVFLAHGADKQQAVNAWAADSGILICTYDGARSLDIPAPGLLIADEAHLIKNPSTKRSRALRGFIDSASHALLMTGTPLENKVDEFVTLVRYLQPELITRGMSMMSAENFRERIAPAYLRRNQADVLDELPERTDSIDWIELSPADRKAYDAEVAAGSWMGMRRSAMLTPPGAGTSAKMARIIELLREAEEHGRRALIFTYFLDVLEELETHLGERVIGRISGDVPATRRQELVDALGAAPAGSALIAQIGAGGVGLNIQVASLCIICEPQVKPTIEQQAVARVHRMGQTATVQVHRLIGDETADERMLEILAGKREIFDVYARLSESAEVPDAVDITETQLAASIIDAERARLGMDRITL